MSSQNSKLTVDNINAGKALILPYSSDDPGDGKAGEITYVNGRLKYHDGEAWYWVGETKGGLATEQGLILKLDATDAQSYPGTGTTWYDLSGFSNNFSIVEGAWNSQGYMDFNGSYGCAKNSSDIALSGDVTYVAVTRVLNSTSQWRTLTRSYTADHHVIIQSGAWDIGMYDNDGSGFIDCGFDQTDLPGYSTGTFDVMCWRWNATSDNPTYDFNVNGVQRGTISNSNARYNRGFGSIGAYHSGNTTPSTSSQPWGDIKFFAVYNRRLSDQEVSSNYTGLKEQFSTN